MGLNSQLGSTGWQVGLGRDDVNPAFDPTGLVGASNARIVSDDDFKRDLCDWGQLFTPTSGTGTTGLRIGTVQHIERFPARLALKTPNLSGVEAMALKRMSNVYGDGRYLMELMFSIEIPAPFGSPLERPRWMTWGLDTALLDGTRRYFKIRYLMYDEAGATAPHKFQFGELGGTGTYTDMTGGVFNLSERTNENKALPHYMALLVNTSTGRYEGFQLDQNIRVGRLATTPDDSLINLGQLSSSSLPVYGGGINSCVEVVNRTAGFTAGHMNLHYHRLSYLGA